MSRRGRAAYYAQIDRPISWCANAHMVGGCGNRNARYSKKDGKTLCAACRALVKPLTVNAEWVNYAHQPGADSGQPLATRLVDMLDGDKPLKLTDPELVREVMSVAELYDGNSSVQDDERLWVRVYPAGLIKRCRAWFAEQSDER